MSNFNVNFSIAWLLLLLIPAIVLTLIPYFRLAKRYRRTRNRIISMVCHIIIMVLCISVLSGMTFSYDKINKESEVVYVVDYSYSGNSEVPKTMKERFVLDSINASRGNFKVGVVAFGYKQYTVMEPSLEFESVREAYSRFISNDSSTLTELIDDTASDISSALIYASDLISNKRGSKIVLVSDGIETDKNAMTTAAELNLTGIQVDTVSFPNRYTSDINDVEVLSVELDSNIKLGLPFNVNITVRSSINSTINFSCEDTYYDANGNAVKDNSDAVFTDYQGLQPGIVSFTFTHTFTRAGLHSLKVTANTRSGGQGDNTDNFAYNNSYVTYFYLDQYNKLLILEGFEGDGERLEAALQTVGSGDSAVTNEITRICIDPKAGGSAQEQQFAALPQDALEMSNYYEIILVNVANSDLTSEKMPANFDVELKSYVENYGGGLFVVGGNEPGIFDSNGHPVPHAFNVTDMKNANSYADLLPVTVETYKPPVALVILVDGSTSMASLEQGTSIMEYCKIGAKALLEDGLTYRDYVGVVKFGEKATTISPMISVRNKAAILNAIDKLEASESDTQFAPAFNEAVRLLRTKGKDEVAKWHIIIISDGDANDNYNNNGAGYGDIVLKNAQDPDIPITVSVAHLNPGSGEDANSHIADMQRLAEDGNGKYYPILTGHAGEIGTMMRSELKGPNISEFAFKEEIITVPNEYYSHPILEGIKGDSTQNPYDRLPTVTGFFATREKTAQKGKPQPEKILQAGYVPLYVQWQYGNGRVGAYMSSLSSGTGDGFSGSSFLADPEGEMLIENIVNTLLPTTDIAPHDIDVVFSEDNYTTTMSIYPKNLEENDNIRIKIYDPGQNPNDPTVTPTTLFWDDTARVAFETKQAGVYTIIVEQIRKDNGGNDVVVASEELYKAFSYSREYHTFVEVDVIDAYMSDLAKAGLGKVVESESPSSVFSDMDIVLHMTYDPRMLFIIISIILFLLDVAVRKFKFKWIHEIIRDRKERKKLMEHKTV